MNIAVSSDESSNLTSFVVRYLRDKGHRIVKLGSLADKHVEWAEASLELAERVASGKCDEGVLFCWTGTGACIAANKTRGIRAALCVDAVEARGARRWNHANVLVMSLRRTSEPMAKEILDAWLSEPYGKSSLEKRNLNRIEAMERKGGNK